MSIGVMLKPDFALVESAFPWLRRLAAVKLVKCFGETSQPHEIVPLALALRERYYFAIIANQQAFQVLFQPVLLKVLRHRESVDDRSTFDCSKLCRGVWLRCEVKIRWCRPGDR